ncbi:hypothetical protein QN357_13860 [Cryobacterium sp. RTC2.1]|uniref:hypothetical protein n=1 Tax=Cryobacterium sp. RTC2.1 TaxID=3048634 RepID=UPI002B231355|nr:hypothetical protein [Cryobacterium sp. RTC2.1]MEB0004012.1 hypothetical protein [Cryobacterium sp. RTC2.1]
MAIWDAQLKLLGYETLSEQTHGGREAALAITQLQSGAFHVKWIAQDGGNASCCGTISAEADVEWSANAGFQVKAFIAHTGSELATRVVKAIADRKSVPDTDASDVAVNALKTMNELQHSIDSSSISCYGSELTNHDYPDRIEVPGSMITCTAPIIDSSQTAVFAMSYSDWNEYKIESAYAE